MFLQLYLPITGKNVIRDGNGDIESVDGIDFNATSNGKYSITLLFGHERNISSMIMNYIGDIRTLFAVSKVNKLLRNSITEEMVIKCAMYSGGRPLASIKNIYRFMTTKSAYIASPLRLLRLCNGRRCEFCNNTKTDEITEYKGKDVSNSKPAVVRPHLNVFACIACLTVHRNEHFCLTSKFERKIWSDHNQASLENGYFLANREILYEIFSHPRVTSYPYGKRWVFTDDNGLVQNAFCREDMTDTTLDRYELMFACCKTDLAGEAIGPLVNRIGLAPLVSYIKQPNNRGIDYYLENIMIPSAPVASDYDNFIRTYEDNIVSAMLRKKERDDNKMTDLLYRLHLKVEHVVRAIGEVVSHMTYKVLRRPYKTYVRKNSRMTESTQDTQQCNRTYYSSESRPPSLRYRFDPGMDKNQVFSMLIRTVLCYYEATEPKLKRPVSYCTGSTEINHILNSILTPLYNDPIQVIGSPKIARNLARTLFIKITSSVDWKIGVSREVTDICGNVRTTFCGRSPDQFAHTASVRVPWIGDTSSHRRP